jgi:hypothetical protein
MRKMILTVRENGGVPAGQSCPSRTTELSIISTMRVSFRFFILLICATKILKTVYSTNRLVHLI